MRKLTGDKGFYKMALAVALPIMIQNGITNFVGLLDNIMVGRLGTEQMSGVAISNQLLFIFNLCIFGSIAGAGIFSAQFHGAKDADGVRRALRFKLYTAAAVCVAGFAVLLLFGEDLISMFLRGDADVGDPASTARFGLQYLRILLLGLVPFAVTASYAGTLRETGETVLPMKSSVISVLTNLVLNYVLIFGHLGFKPMGVQGAAIATVIARLVECAYILIGTHRGKKHEFARGLFRSFRVPLPLVRRISVKGLPLLVNEILWSSGMVLLVQLYSTRGLSVISALNISTTVTNMFSIVYYAMGNAVAIIVGQLLGAGELEKAREADTKLIFLSVLSCAVTGVVLAGASPFVPLLYKTEPAVRALASQFMLIAACCMPLFAFSHASYFTLRAGGKTLITFLFDCASLWGVVIPSVWLLVNRTGLAITAIYLCAQLLELVKCTIGFIFVKKGVWLVNLAAEKPEKEAA